MRQLKNLSYIIIDSATAQYSVHANCFISMEYSDVSVQSDNSHLKSVKINLFNLFDEKLCTVTFSGIDHIRTGHQNSNTFTF